MTLARILDVRGEFARLGFDCKACKKDRELNEMRGCGVSPINMNGVAWDADKWLASELQLSGGAMPAAHLATPHYTWANIGKAMELTGSPWPCCPAWFSRFYEGPESLIANSAIEVSGYVRRKMLPLVGNLVLGADSLQEVVRALNIFDVLKSEAEERSFKEAQANAKVKK